MFKVLAVAVGLTCTGSEPSIPTSVQGEIALTNSPFCEFFVVRTWRGFSLLWWRGGMLVFAEGDRVVGLLHTVGDTEIAHVLEPQLNAAIGPITTNVRVEAVGIDLLTAQRAYFSHCQEQHGPETATH